MIYVSAFQAQLIQAGLFVGGIALLGFGYYLYTKKKPKIKPVKKSIYDRPVRQPKENQTKRQDRRK